MFSSSNNTTNMNKFLKLEGQLVRRKVKGFMQLSADNTGFYMAMETKYERVTLENGREVIVIENKRGTMYITFHEGECYVCTLHEAAEAAVIMFKNEVNKLTGKEALLIIADEIGIRL